MTISDKIQSLGQNVGATYYRPEPARLEKYQQLLLGNDTALHYLRAERNLTDETIKHFGLGYDSEKQAIAIPVYKRGELINIKYRYLDPEKKPKYTQEKNAEVWVYNEDGIQAGMKKGGVLIVEGEFDLMSAWQGGFSNVVSPASGKDSYGIWIELIDNIPKVFIAYDNDKPGRESSLKIAERLGFEKCSEVLYPAEIKDANEYFKRFNANDYRELIRTARPFYKHQFKSLVDIIEEMRSDTSEKLKFKYLPDVKVGNDWLVVVSGKSNVGKTSYIMNLAAELVDKNIPVLVLPFERGPQVVGTRYLQVKYGLSEGDVTSMSPDDWQKITEECINAELYFSMPTKDETMDIIVKSKRIFNTRVVFIDHLDYMIRNTKNKEQEIGSTLQELKRLAEEHKIIMVIVTHIRKIESPGTKKGKKPGIEDLKGSASLYQDPECVAMLTSPEKAQLTVDIAKNKGKMSNKTYAFNEETGKLADEVTSVIVKNHGKSEWGAFGDDEE